MKEEKHIDELFKSALDGFSEAPSAAVWKSVSRKLSWNEFTSFNFTNFGSNLYQLTTVGIAAFSVVGYTTYTVLQPSVVPVSEKPEVVISNPEKNVEPDISQEKTYVAKAEEFTTPKPKINSEDLNVKVEETVPAFIPETAELNLIRTNDIYSTIPSRTANLQAEKASIFMGISGLNYWQDTLRDQLSRINETVELPWRFGFYAGYSYEQMHLPKPSEAYEFNYNTFDLYGRIEKGRFNLQLGIQYSRQFDQNSNLLTYKSYDSVGYYYDVHYYIPDPNQPQNVILVTSTITRFDSVPKNFTVFSNYSYDYLNIPIIAGIRLWENPKFYCEIAAGPSVQLLLSSKEPSVPVYQTFKSSSATYPQTFVRNKLLFQMNTSMRLGYTIDSHMRIELEPVFRYAFTDLYKDVSLPRPYSYGLKAGFVYIF
ncbi:MAG: hypothetical protein Q7J34_06095 [Bacteroidales bacterium]|jgi:hypothetical protein|nr:hypothetical protein [Bacteroidales bacterium]